MPIIIKLSDNKIDNKNEQEAISREIFFPFGIWDSTREVKASLHLCLSRYWQTLPINNIQK